MMHFESKKRAITLLFLFLLPFAWFGGIIQADEVHLDPKLLSDKLLKGNRDEREEAARTILEMDELPEEFIPEIKMALKDKDPHVRRISVDILISKQVKGILEELLQLTNDPIPDVRYLAVLGINDISPANKGVEELTRIVANSEESFATRALAADTLGNMGKNSESALPALKKSSWTHDEELHSASVLAYKKIKSSLGRKVDEKDGLAPKALKRIHKKINFTSVPVKLDDTLDSMTKKLHSVGATNLGDKILAEFRYSVAGREETHWWMLPDKTVVAIYLLEDDNEMKVAMIQTGEPGIGVKGLANWADDQDVQIVKGFESKSDTKTNKQ